MNDSIKEYQRLLLAPAALEALEQSFVLVRDIIRRYSKKGRRVEWKAAQIEHYWRGSDDTRDNVIARYLTPTVREPLGQTREHEITVNTVLTLHVGGKEAQQLEGDAYSFLMDALLVVFHHSYFALLPRLEASQLVLDKKALLLCYHGFAHINQAPADIFRVRALIFLALDRPAQAAREFTSALLATHADEHDFMTRLQAAWSTLMDSKAYQEAFDLLMQISPKIIRQDIDEFSGLMRETFETVRGEAASR